MAFRDFSDDAAPIQSNPADGHRASTRLANRADIKVLQLLGREIVSGIYPADERLPDEASMLARYRITRTALREAYAQLTAKGMIVARPKVGTSVTPPASWNMLDADVLRWHLETRPLEEIVTSLHPLRRMIEPGAAALAAQLRTQEQLDRLERAYQLMKSAGQDRDALLSADLSFHLEILVATHNPFIRAFSGQLRAIMQKTLPSGWDGVESAALKPARLLQHLDVLEAIRVQNADMARMRMEILIDDSLKDVLLGLETGADGALSEGVARILAANAACT
ncbi:FadR/GntR family transcriptional regulator [uncultured Devosia sp.]|uniref:FadR/GntR family transcriptional regulator n=1 Tax=uncultured Devosia sp. TaxID=211434 RepID=UPI002613CEC7|nr:FadR/GntR family transcriptional regulator [uncultured Devosia sp.]